MPNLWSNRPEPQPLTIEALRKALDSFNKLPYTPRPTERVVSAAEYQHIREHGCAADPLCWFKQKTGISDEEIKEWLRRELDA